ncbi:MAG: alpha-isopropylmalate synthase regulatory domain-containing protein, partial [Burkholderiales bacterium]
QRLQELGIELESEVEVNAAFGRFKELADKKSDIFDEDIHALFADRQGAGETETYRLVSMKQRSETGEKPQAELVFTEEGVERKANAEGSGPVDATFKAIESVAKSGAELVIYSVNAVTSGTESQGEVTVRLSRAGRIVNGVGADTDIIVASAKAYLNALNKLASKTVRVNPQSGQ